MKLHCRLLLQAATVALAGAVVGLPQSASAADYDRIKQVAEENGITELRMTEAGGPSGDSIEQGYLDPFTEGERDRGGAREPERTRQAARHGRGRRRHLRGARALEPRARAGQGARSGRAARLGRDRPAADVRGGQGRERLRLPVLLDHHGLARRRQGAAELAGLLGRRGFPGQAGAAGLRRLHPADGAAGRRRPGGRALPARPRPGVREPREDQGRRRGMVAGGRAAAAAPPGQRGAVRRGLVGPRRGPGRHRLQLPGRPARHRLLRRAQGSRSQSEGSWPTASSTR